MANYQDIEKALEELRPFKGNSLNAVATSDGGYLVFSYSTPIASVAKDGARQLDATKYSKTTSHHQNIIKRAWGL